MGGRILAASFAIALAIVLPRKAEAQCGAICLYEVGSPDNAMSAAGASARAQDAATALFNIAGTTRLKGFQVMAATVAGFIDQEFKVSSSTQPQDPGNSGGSLGGFAPLGAAFLSTQVYGTPLRFALSFAGLYGGNLDYDNDWAGRTWITQTSLAGLNLAPGLAYPLEVDQPYCKRLSIGGAVDVVYLKLDYQRKANSKDPFSPTLEINDAKDWTLAGTVAVLYELSDATRFGLNYRTPTDVNLTGDFDSPADTVRFDSKFELAQGVNFGVFHSLTPELAVLADAGWSDWSTFDYQAITYGSTPTNLVPRSFEDTWRIGAGLQYSHGAGEPCKEPAEEGCISDGDWRLSGGFSFDSSPVDAGHRLPDIPVSEQYRFSLGFQKIAGNVRLGGGYTFFWSPNNEIKDAQLLDIDNQGVVTPGVLLNGEYDRSYAHFLSVSVEVRFAGILS